MARCPVINCSTIKFLSRSSTRCGSRYNALSRLPFWAERCCHGRLALQFVPIPPSCHLSFPIRHCAEFPRKGGLCDRRTYDDVNDSIVNFNLERRGKVVDGLSRLLPRNLHPSRPSNCLRIIKAVASIGLIYFSPRARYDNK